MTATIPVIDLSVLEGLTNDAELNVKVKNNVRFMRTRAFINKMKLFITAHKLDTAAFMTLLVLAFYFMGGAGLAFIAYLLAFGYMFGVVYGYAISKFVNW